MRDLPAISFATSLALCGCDGTIFEPDQPIETFEVEADEREAILVLRDLAEQHGLEVKGGFYLPPVKAATPPVDEATIRTGDCLLVASMRGSVLEVALKAREQTSCPPAMHAIFDQAQRQLTPGSKYRRTTS